MKFGEILRLVEGTALTRHDDSKLDILSVAGCDLMSDVLTYSRSGALLLTGLVNAHVIHTAEMADLVAIVFVRGKTPTPEVIANAEEKGIPLATSPFSMFELCGRLYQAGLVSCNEPVHE
jgi:predicted transcriptional regulator